MPTPLAATLRWLDRFRSGTSSRLVIAPTPSGASVLVARAGPRLERILAADLRADGLLGPDEMSARLGDLLAELPQADAVLVLPPGLTHSQIQVVAPGDARGNEQLAAEAVGAAGRSDVVAVAPLPGPGRALWISVARAEAVESQLRRCGLPPGRIVKVLGSDAALAAAFLTQPERPALAVVLDLGRVCGQLLVLEQGSPALAADLDWGMDKVRAALAADLGRVESSLSTLLAEAPGLPTLGTPRLAAVLRGLGLAVEGLLADFARERGLAREQLASAPRWLSGPGMSDPAVYGLIARAAGGPGPRAWETVPAGDGAAWNPAEALPAYGAARIAFAADAAPDFSPAVVRAARKSERHIALLHALATLFALAGLGIGLARLEARRDAVAVREVEVVALRAARDALPSLAEARRQRENAYLAALPALALQKRTRDFVAGLRLLGETRTDDAFWFALVADAETYQAGALPKGTPTSTPETQQLPGLLGRRSGLVVELSFRPGGPDPLSRVDGLVAALRDTGGFARVDLLPARERQANLADRSVYAAEGADFALRLDSTPFVGPIPENALQSAAGGGLFFSP